MATKRAQWMQDLDWLLAKRYPGWGGHTALAKALSAHSDGVTSTSVHYWVHRKRRPNYENRRALMLLRERVAGEINKGGNQDE